jgi:hypothetical protein
MFGCVALNAEIAACWKFVWNVEPLALIVPLAAAALEDDPVAAEDPADVGAELDVVLDEEQAARASAATTAPPATAACLLPRSCI